MSSGVIGMRSPISSMRGHNTYSLNSDSIVTASVDTKKYVIQLLERLDSMMAEEISDHKSSHKFIAKVCDCLKSEGSLLDNDSAFRQELDLYFDLLRNILRKPKLSPFSRTKILEVIELRASNWSSNEDIEEYYVRKMAELEANDSYCLANDFGSELQKSQSFALNAIGSDSIKCSQKNTKPVKVSGKTFIKDEVLIRNGDSGKVTAGAKERLVQITGSSEESIERAKELIETTIKRNASPDPMECHKKSFDSNFSRITSETNKTMTPHMESTPIQKCEPITTPTIEPIVSHTFTVEVNNDVIQLSTTNYDLGLKAQHLLKESLLCDTPLKVVQQSIQNNQRRQSTADSSAEDLEPKVDQRSYRKEEVMAALDSLRRGAPTEAKPFQIQRSSSQGTVPMGRTSLRFMSKSVGHEEPNSKITYERKFLMECSQLPYSKCIPNVDIMEKIYQKTPEIVRKHRNSGEKANTSAPLLKSKSFSESRMIVVNDWK